ncbi:MAG: hypothetical protein LBD05_00260 [Mycoplasmataceae bacterium]|jgi:hypothetical protein|nr:hypothetical protein [Mycoplasmataceae bacterium]
MKNINKYTIISSLNNKNLEKDIIVLEKMNKSDNSNDKPFKPKQQKQSKIDLLIQQFGEFRSEVNTRFDKIENTQVEQGKEINAIKINQLEQGKKIDNIETRIDKIEKEIISIKGTLTRNNIY